MLDLKALDNPEMPCFGNPEVLGNTAGTGMEAIGGEATQGGHTLRRWSERQWQPPGRQAKSVTNLKSMKM